MNQKVIITRGLSGSGKTTWSNQFVSGRSDYVRISRDDIDFMLSEKYYDKRKEELIFRTRDKLILLALTQGFNLVLDETYLVSHRVAQLNLALQSYVDLWSRHLDIEIKDFLHVPIEQCIERDKSRFFHVGEKFIRDYHKKYIVPLLKDPGITKWTI